MEKLARVLDHLDVTTYRYKQLSLAYRQLILQCMELAETIDQIDVVVFEARQAFDLLNAALKEEWEASNSERS